MRRVKELKKSLLKNEANFSGSVLGRLLYWQKTDKSILNKINSLLKEIGRTPFEGTGKPELLKYNLNDCWSRRINPEHRLVYKLDGESIVVLQCR
ncbi:toxin YoeB [Pedobacter westerhofensis]|uniref:Putative mRNA interferase YoeB n=1 Tax=Pedobacter westerhofensis TaxID=425512 RepID=A0A521FQ16_9SPHI|nr:Txe/YoeB family addiction module toxin [Pedobacter westerhofensis]SMO98269.1 toxin YoeB [Pedobacter westerhofensis]